MTFIILQTGFMSMLKQHCIVLKMVIAPFYLHKSQNTFMQKHPNEKYHIIRISLNDLDLQKSYERIRDIYGKEANPMIDERLKEDCLKIAKKY